MTRLPVPGGDDGVWGDILNDYLLQSHAADGALKTGVVNDDHVTSISQAKVTGLPAALSSKADATGAVFTQGATLLDPVVTNVYIWQAPFACAVTRIAALRSGGTGCTMNIRKNGAQNLLSIDLSVSTAGNWMTGVGLQNATLGVNDSLEIMITAVTGSPAQVAVQLNFVTS